MKRNAGTDHTDHTDCRDFVLGVGGISRTPASALAYDKLTAGTKLLIAMHSELIPTANSRVATGEQFRTINSASSILSAG